MRRSPYLSGPPSPYRGVALLGLVVLVATTYVACGGNDRSYGSGSPNTDSGLGGDNPGSSGGKTGGSSGASGRGGNAGSVIGGGGSGNAAGRGGNAGSVIGGGGGTGIGNGGSGPVKDAADDGPLSNAN
jgi:hypothetical protein